MVEGVLVSATRDTTGRVGGWVGGRVLRGGRGQRVGDVGGVRGMGGGSERWERSGCTFGSLVREHD